MKAGEFYVANTPVDDDYPVEGMDPHRHTHRRRYKLLREQAHDLDPSVKGWLCLDLATDEERFWPSACFGKELTKA